MKTKVLGFYQKVYGVVGKIPPGKVATYGQIAQMLGTKDARKVGWALHGNKHSSIPCHRVVNKEGGVAENYAFGEGWREQKKKLEGEGITFKDQKCVGLGEHIWTKIT